MTTDFFTKTLLKNFVHSPTTGQSELIQRMTNFVLSKKIELAFIVKGYAGTGKTTLISALVKTLKELSIKHILLAPTGRAAKVFTLYSQSTAYTIHKKIYRQKSNNEGFGKFQLDKNLHKDTIFIIDEASMISNQSSDLNVFGSGRLLDDLVKYIFTKESKCKLILLGDTAQLPPVGTDLSPALDLRELQAYGLNVGIIELTEVLRQSEDSGILHNATYLRKLICENNQPINYPKLELEGFNDIERLSGENLIEKINSSYDMLGIEQTLIVTRSNERANRFNQGIRNSILWRENEIATGDILMIVKNNYYWIRENEKVDFIANGDIAEVVKIIKYEYLYNLKFANVVLKFLDYDNLEIEAKIILDTLNIRTAALSSEENNRLYQAIAQDYAELNNKRTIYTKIKENPHFNALQVKFAYSVTCHKAQGGQWKHVFIDQGYLTEEMINNEYLIWLYTAITRAREKVYLFNFNKEFFNE